MSKYVAFLRGINVGGKNMIPMAELRKLAAGAGLTDPQTHLQSGNLLFGGQARTENELEELLERKNLEQFGFAIDYHVRSIDHLRLLAEKNPFPQEARDDPSHLVVAFFKAPLDPAACGNLRSAIRGRERFLERDREAFIVYPDGIGESKLTNALMDSKLGLLGTARNWNTILKLVELGG